MTIDEAIQDFRQLEYEFEHYMCDTEDKKENLMKFQREWEHYKQLAEWLEELKKLREAKPKEIPIATININEKDLRELVGEKLKEIELDIQAIRNEAIDDFAERIALEISESIIWGILVNSDKDNSFSDTTDKIVDYVIDTSKEIAEQLKKGVEE